MNKVLGLGFLLVVFCGSVFAEDYYDPKVFKQLDAYVLSACKLDGKAELEILNDDATTSTVWIRCGVDATVILDVDQTREYKREVYSFLGQLRDSVGEEVSQETFDVVTLLVGARKHYDNCGKSGFIGVSRYDFSEPRLLIWKVDCIHMTRVE